MPLVADLLEWAGANHRDLPWRSTRDPWAICVSELMAQQTQVDRVIPKYLAFLDRFPTPSSCAESSVGDVIALWSGLGYNRRAVFMHRIAIVVTERFHGSFPDSYDELVSLPGVGPYTARAILAFAFEKPYAVVDTNVGRVLARWNNLTLKPKEVQQLADEALDVDSWRWNSAMLDFGANLCTKKSPKCDVCPVQTECGWRGIGEDPAHGSAGVSGKQSKFEGSFRQGRGRILKQLSIAPVAIADVAKITMWEEQSERVQQAIDSLIGDHLAVVDGNLLRLP